MGVLCYVKVHNFDLCRATLKIELESCRCWFRTYSGALQIRAKKVDLFLGSVWPPLLSSVN